LAGVSTVWAASEKRKTHTQTVRVKINVLFLRFNLFIFSSSFPPTLFLNIL